MSSIKNNYNDIAEDYHKSDSKPDKLYSILPTIISLAEAIEDKDVLDLGCGDGFFTEVFVQSGARHVTGIDNSQKQIELAKSIASNKGEYLLADVFTNELPKADIINCPFILNYLKDANALSDFLQRLHGALNVGGKVILVYDLPSGKNLEKFGAHKTLAEDKDGADIKIDLYSEGKLICTLNAVYYREYTIKKLLHEAGFKEIKVQKPTISKEGINKFGSDFWKGYVENSELGYITAEKS